MVEIGYLASTVLMGLVLVGLATAFVLGYRRRQYSVRTAEPVDHEPGGTLWATYDRFAAAGQRETVWTVGFLLLATLLVAGVGLFLSGSVPEATLGPLLAGVLGFVLVGYLLAGIYRTLRVRNRPRAEAVAVSTIVAGLLFLAAVATKLIAA